MIETTAVIGKLLEIDNQISHVGTGWDIGVGVWGIHGCEAPEDEYDFIKLNGSDYQNVHPMELLQHFPPQPSCFDGVVISWQYDAPYETRYTLAALRRGCFVLVEHPRNGRPRATVLSQERLLSVVAAYDIGMRLVQALQPSLPSGMPPFLRALLGGADVQILNLSDLFGPDLFEEGT